MKLKNGKLQNLIKDETTPISLQIILWLPKKHSKTGYINIEIRLGTKKHSKTCYINIEIRLGTKIHSKTGYINIGIRLGTKKHSKTGNINIEICLGTRAKIILRNYQSMSGN